MQEKRKETGEIYNYGCTYTHTVTAEVGGRASLKIYGNCHVIKQEKVCYQRARYRRD